MENMVSGEHYNELLKERDQLQARVAELEKIVELVSGNPGVPVEIDLLATQDDQPEATLDDIKAALAEYGYIAVKTNRITSVMHLVEELHVTSRDAECELGMLIEAAKEAADHE